VTSAAGPEPGSRAGCTPLLDARSAVDVPRLSRPYAHREGVDTDVHARPA